MVARRCKDTLMLKFVALLALGIACIGWRGTTRPRTNTLYSSSLSSSSRGSSAGSRLGSIQRGGLLRMVPSGTSITTTTTAIGNQPHRRVQACASELSSSSSSSDTTGKSNAPKSASSKKAEKIALQMEKDMVQNQKPKLMDEPRFNRTLGRDKYNPQTYFELIGDATQSVRDAIRDGLDRMEVELAALGQETYTFRADTFVDVNAALATALGAGLAGDGLRVRILLPDNAEVIRQNRMLKTTMGKRMREEMKVLGDKLVFGSLTEASPSLDERVGSAFTSLFNGGKDTVPKPPEDPEDVFIVINAGVLDLPLVETYYEKIAKGRKMILMNLELDTLRGDLGLPAFPSKDLHYRFLSYFKPVFYLRNRKYAKTMATPPYNIDYAGSLFRDYPGPWQVMLKLGDGSLACVAERPERFYLNEAKYAMADALGIAEEKGSVMNFLRMGYKAGTWWEEGENQELSNSWRS